MSYNRTETRTIHGSVTGSFSYPSSENGGTEHVTLNWSEDVHIDVTVEDDPFNHGVEACKQHIDAMTASVVATETAQLASKAAASKKVGETVVQGFFGLIQSEIAQQMTELASGFSPKLQELNNFATRCVSLRQQMERDFHRILERYSRLFGDLDRELTLRIKTLDRAAFSLQKQSSDPTADILTNSQVTIPILSGSEIETTQAQLLAHTIRQRAFTMIHSARERIASGTRLNESLKAICENISVEAPLSVFIPVLFIEEDGLQDRQKIRLISSPNQPLAKALEDQQQNTIEQVDNPSNWAPMHEDIRARIDKHVSHLILQHMSKSNDLKNQREAALIQDLWDKISISSMQGAI